jgi:hypothetical protein
MKLKCKTEELFSGKVLELCMKMVKLYLKVNIKIFN